MAATRRTKPAMQRTPDSMPKAKERFIAHLAQGHTPTIAAEKAGIGRATAYFERAKDPEFATAWEDAAQQGIDRLEERCRDRAMEDSDALMALMLRGRRPEVYAQQRAEPPRISITQTVLTQEEAFKRVEDLGLPPLMIEAPYEEIEDDSSS